MKKYQNRKKTLNSYEIKTNTFLNLIWISTDLGIKLACTEVICEVKEWYLAF